MKKSFRGNKTNQKAFREKNELLCKSRRKYLNKVDIGTRHNDVIIHKDTNLRYIFLGFVANIREWCYVRKYGSNCVQSEIELSENFF